MMQCLFKMHQAQGSIAVTGSGGVGRKKRRKREEGRVRNGKVGEEIEGEGRGGERERDGFYVSSSYYATMNC